MESYEVELDGKTYQGLLTFNCKNRNVTVKGYTENIFEGGLIWNNVLLCKSR